MRVSSIRPERLLHDSLLISAERFPEKTAVIVGAERYTYAELRRAALALSQTLRRQGVRRGDRVAIYMDNTWPSVVAIYGALMAGAVFLVINPQTKADKLSYILLDSEARVLLTDGHLSKVFGSVVGRIPSLEGIFCAGRAPKPRECGGQSILPFDEAMSGECTSLPQGQPLSIDLAALIYTSGSTGHPKGVMMTHQSMVFTNGSLVEYLRLSEGHRILNVMPLAFDYGLYQLFMAVRTGGTLVLERSFNYPGQVLKQLALCEATVFPAVPTIYALLLSMHARKRLCFPSVVRVTNTAAALPVGFIPGIKEVFPNALIYKMYGLTECKRVAYLEPEEVDAKTGSVGRAIPGTEVFLLSPEGDPVPSGEVGILHVRGAHVMQGYWNLPDRTAEMLKPGRLPGERILCTTDWFRQDEDGYLYFVGRNDDIIKTRGEKVSPVEVENVLHSIEGVREAAVLGVPDEVLGEALRAYLALEPTSHLTEKEVKRICLTKLESFMVPKEVVFLPELPKTDNGKIRKSELRQIVSSLGPAQESPRPPDLCLQPS